MKKTKSTVFKSWRAGKLGKEWKIVRWFVVHGSRDERKCSSFIWRELDDYFSTGEKARKFLDEQKEAYPEFHWHVDRRFVLTSDDGVTGHIIGTGGPRQSDQPLFMK